ncbi:MAG: Hpt domain-containing protein [Alphaproteobacteria bacterium]|nr:Hpt domain-containing protein [Alphaproteobacteria bacterium]
MTGGPARVIRPKNRLAERCAAPAGTSGEALIARMEAALAAHVEANRALIPDRVGELRELSAQGDKAGLLAAAHEIKGLAGTFGFALIGRLAESLTRYLRDKDASDEALVRMHVDAMLAGVSGDEERRGAVTEAVAAGLEELVSRAPKAPAA